MQVDTRKNSRRIAVGIGDFEVAQSPQILETYSLGSCVGIALYDSTTQTGGLAHIMLPDSKSGLNSTNRAKFADTAIDLMLKDLQNLGAIRNRLTAKIAGGASMFSAAVQDPALAIGSRNVEAVKLNLKAHHISLVSEDTGGNWGRTMEFLLENGTVSVKSAMKGTKEI